MGSDIKVIELVKMGQVDICHTSAGNYASVGRALMPFNLPFLISGGTTKWYMLLTGEIRDLINERFEKDGFKLLMLYHQGMTRDLMTTKKPIRTFADAKGIKLRSVASPINQALLRAWGLNPVPIAWSECYTALSQGVVNGIYVDPMSAEMSKISEVVKYVTRPGGALLLSGAVMNLKNYEKLPPEIKVAVDRAAAEAELWAYGIEQELKTKAIIAMKKKGVEFIDLSPEDQATFEKTARGTWDDLIQKLKLDKNFIDQVVAAGEKISLD
jgi:TRAP-type C4-dicarboxylate transport system substrate-binding protein